LYGLAAGIVIALAASARAQLLLPGNFYVGAEGGWTRLLTVLNRGHPDDTGPFVGQDAVSSESFNSGFNVGGRAGFQSGPWRLEGELSYRSNGTEHLQMLRPINRPGRFAGAERHSLSEMVNLMYDINLGLPVTPHVGGGIGAAEVPSRFSPIRRSAGSGI
jgi:opacity protein-like surface antigen